MKSVTSLTLLLRKYLSDPTEDVRVAAENILGEFLREIRGVSLVQHQLGEQIKAKLPVESARIDPNQERLPDLTLDTSERAVFINENDDFPDHENESAIKDDFVSSGDERGTGGKIVNRSGIFN